MSAETKDSSARTVLICHHDDQLNREFLARWLSSFTELAGIIIIDEPGTRLRKRVNREYRRVGVLRFLDVLAFQFYYRLCLRRRDQERLKLLMARLDSMLPPLPETTRILTTRSPNSMEAQKFLDEAQPDLVIARCKNILAKRIFQIPRIGCFVMHPGICPQYRNAHGCFWALALRDLDHVGMTLLKVDEGIDTGPVYGYYSYHFDERRESHIEIQERVVFDNLDALRDKFQEIIAGQATRLNTAGAPSKEWGQPWLTAYLRWKAQAGKAPHSS